MKRIAIIILTVLALCLCLSGALADTYYVKPDISVSLRDPVTNEVLIMVPAGTPLEPEKDRSTDLFAFVSYGGNSGMVMWNYLTSLAPGETAPAPATATVSAPAAQAPAAPGVMTLRTINAVIQRANSKNKAEGAEMTEMTVTAADNVIITVRVPRGRKLDYWVINGVRYDFLRNVQSFRMTAFDQSWTIEAVFKKTDSTTLHTPQAIQAARTGQPLRCRTINAEFCHLKSDTKGAGGWMTEFDFTQDYLNRATNAMEQGGQLSAKVRAVIPKGKKAIGWKFDETEIYPKGATVKQFVVYTLDTSMTYEPIFGKEAAKPKVTTPPGTEVKYVNVTCINCRITGGPYGGRTSAKVPVGTKITVTADEHSSEVYWEINGSTGNTPGGRSITRTIKTNTTIKAYPVIN